MVNSSVGSDGMVKGCGGGVGIVVTHAPDRASHLAGLPQYGADLPVGTPFITAWQGQLERGETRVGRNFAGKFLTPSNTNYYKDRMKEKVVFDVVYDREVDALNNRAASSASPLPRREEGKELTAEQLDRLIPPPTQVKPPQLCSSLGRWAWIVWRGTRALRGACGASVRGALSGVECSWQPWTPNPGP